MTKYRIAVILAYTAMSVAVIATAVNSILDALLEFGIMAAAD